MTPDEALATGKKKWRTVRLTKANFSNIAKTAKEFEQYIETLRGSDSQNARESELRYDEWDPERPMARKQYPASGTMRESVNQFRSSERRRPKSKSRLQVMRRKRKRKRKRKKIARSLRTFRRMRTNSSP
jgi:hypothetical protein